MTTPYSTTSVVHHLKEAYLIWINIVPHIPKSAHYTISAGIENKFLELLELSYTTYFSKKEDKKEKITECILILDTLKFIISIAWEAKLISHKQYEEIALKLNEIGKMFGGWRNSLNNPQKKNRRL